MRLAGVVEHGGMFGVPLSRLTLLCVAMFALSACADHRDDTHAPHQIPVIWGHLDGGPGLHVVFIGDFDMDGAYLVDGSRRIRYMLVNQMEGGVFLLAGSQGDLDLSIMVLPNAVLAGGDHPAASSMPAYSRPVVPRHYVLLAGHGAQSASEPKGDQIMSGEIDLAFLGAQHDDRAPFTVALCAFLSGYVQDDGHRCFIVGKQDLVCRMK